MPKKIVFNDAQIAELKEMLNNNVKQLDIACHFHVTDDTIRRICRENGFEIKMPHKCVCVICGDTFYSNRANAKTCKKEHHAFCAVCGKDFIVDRTNIRDTCSLRCYSLKKYGTEHPSAAHENIEKRAAGMLKKYGVANPGYLSDHNVRV